MILRNTEARIENCSICNGRCIICPREKMTRPRMIMPQEHFENLVLQAKGLGAKTISIFGYGEPLIDAKVIDKVQFCSGLGLETFITTNATLLDSDMAFRLLDAGLTHIRFSIHGLWAKDYEKVHGLDMMLVLRNVMNFLVVNKMRFKNKCKTSVTAIPLNGEDIESIKKFWEPYVDWLEIWKPHNWTDGREFRKVQRKKKSCGRPFDGPIQINADGKVMVCCMDFDAMLTVGDTYKDSLEAIIKGEKFREIRQKHESGDLTGLICEKCDQLNIEDENPLIYSNRDPDRKINTTSSTKHEIREN